MKLQLKLFVTQLMNKKGTCHYFLLCHYYYLSLVTGCVAFIFWLD